jgi:hypothetical protein
VCFTLPKGLAYLFHEFSFGHYFALPFFAVFFGADSEVMVGVGDDRAINTAKLVGGGSAALQPIINRPKAHAAPFFSFPAMLGSLVICSLRTIPRLPVSSRLRFGLSLERYANHLAGDGLRTAAYRQQEHKGNEQDEQNERRRDGSSESP